MEKDPFKEYLSESEPDKAHKGYAWSTAIGLQAVDGLKPSKYLIDTAIQNIEGKITMQEAQNLIDSYYKERPVHLSDDERTEEADKVSSRIAEILSETAFSFSPNAYKMCIRDRFNELKRYLKTISDKTLSMNLKELEADRLIVRTEYPQIPPKVEYSLSERGKSLMKVLDQLCVWGEENRLTE